MRTACCLLLLLCAIIGTSCAQKESDSNKNGARHTPPTQASQKSQDDGNNICSNPLPLEQDRQVIETVLNDLRGIGDSVTFGSNRPTGPMVLHVNTSDVPFENSIDRQLRSDIRKYVSQLPDDAYECLVQRSQRPASLAAWTFSGDTILISDLNATMKKAKYPLSAFEDTYPQARGWARIRLPGYTRNGATAVVRLTVGPTPHGATATYLLKRQADGWSVIWRVYTPYV